MDANLCIYSHLLLYFSVLIFEFDCKNLSRHYLLIAFSLLTDFRFYPLYFLSFCCDFCFESVFQFFLVQLDFVRNRYFFSSIFKLSTSCQVKIVLRFGSLKQVYDLFFLFHLSYIADNISITWLLELGAIMIVEIILSL